MKRELIIAVCVALTGVAYGQRQPEIVAYYQQWLGCKAPPIRFDSSDRTDVAEPNYKDKKVLLYGLNSGDFANSPNMEQLLTELKELAEVWTPGAKPFHIICYTRGLVLAGTLAAPLSEEIRNLTQFPWVNLNNKHGDNALGEPYEMLHSPGGILIDTNGVICRIYPDTMRKADFMDAATVSAWGKVLVDPPKQTADALWDSIPKTTVLVAWRDLATGQRLLPSPRTIAADVVPNARLPTNAIPREDIRNVLGATLRANVPAHQTLTWDILDTSTVDTNLVPAKRPTTTPVPLRSSGEGER